MIILDKFTILPDCSDVVGQVIGDKHEIVEPVSCDCEICIYYWKCAKPNFKDYPPVNNS